MDTSISEASCLSIKLVYSDITSLDQGPQRMSHKTIYFGYGSNLWLDQMRRRCPTSKYLGIARLKGYKWIIFSRGAANIVELSSNECDVAEHDYTKEVWGLVYSLEPDDEKKLDGYEAVPVYYVKQWIECEFWPIEHDEHEKGPSNQLVWKKPDISKEPKAVDMLVYINRELTVGSKPKEEYIVRMNHAIHDALQEGVPKNYVEKVIRDYIPSVDDVA